MKNILKDAAKIRSFVQIQENLNELPENATETEINSLIENIPKQMLTQKDDLMIICKLFAYYARNFQQTSKKNAINYKTNLNFSLTYLVARIIFIYTCINKASYR